jgi:hypothetical protein
VKPLAIDLYCGLGGWAEGFLAEGYDVIGFDTERHDYGTGGYPGQLVLQDVLTIHGSQFKNAAVIVASPPCQKYSYMAMPWSKAKALAAWYRENLERQVELNQLFNACFRIQCEASEAAGWHIPLIVENVKGAQPWVGRAQAHFGSFYLWGDVGQVGNRVVVLNGPLRDIGIRPRSRAQKCPGFRFDGSGKSFQSESVRVAESGAKSPAGNGSNPLWKDREVARYAHPTPEEAEKQGFKLPGQNWSRFAKAGEISPHWRMEAGRKQEPIPGCNGGWFGDYQAQKEAIKQGGDWFGKNCESSMSRLYGSKSAKRKAASAQIAKIPFPLAQHIARCFRPLGVSTGTNGQVERRVS